MDSFTIRAILSVQDMMSKGLSQASRAVGDFAQRVEAQANRVPASVTSAMDKAGSATMKIGTAMTAAAGTFGVGAVKAASEAQAMQAQFNQTFGELSGKAQQELNGMAKEVGMLPNRLKSPFSMSTAMFKGLGMSTEEAMQKASQATKLAADGAAFYDKSFEEANQALNSFIKGNYEGGEAIGLFANDTQMAQYAIKQGVVSSTAEWQRLDEATKQATRLEYAQNMYNMAGATGQAARESGNWNNVMGNLKQALQDLMAKMGEPFMQPFLDGVKKATTAIQDLTKWAEENPKKVEMMGKAFFTVGPALLAFGGLLKMTASTITTFQTITSTAKVAVDGLKTAFSLLSSPITIAITAIIAIIGVVVYFYNTNETVRNTINSVWTTVQTAIQTAVTMITTIINTLFGPAIEFFKSQNIGMKDIVITAWNIIKAGIANTINLIATIIQVTLTAITTAWKVGWEGIKMAVTVVWAAIKMVVQSAMDIVKGVIQVGTALIKGDWQGAWEAIKTMFSNVWNNIKQYAQTAITAVKTAISNGLNAIKTGWNNIWNSIKTFFQNWWTNTKNVAKNSTENMKQAITNGINAIKSKWTSIWNNIKQTFSNVMNNLKSKAKEGVEKIKSAFDALKELPKRMLQIGKDIVNGIWNGIVSMWGNLVAKVKSKVDGLVNSIKSALDIHSPSRVLRDEVGRWIPAGIEVGMQDGQRSLERTAKDMAMSAVPDVPNVVGGIGNAFSRLNDEANSTLNANLSANATINDKAMNVKLNLGGKEFEAFASSIDVQNGKTAKLTAINSI